MMSIDEFRNLIHNFAKFNNLYSINILGGNILCYPEIEEVMNMMQNEPYIVSYYMHIYN